MANANQTDHSHPRPPMTPQLADVFRALGTAAHRPGRPASRPTR